MHERRTADASIEALYRLTAAAEAGVESVDLSGLQLSNSQLDRLDVPLAQLGAMRDLDLSGNALTALPDWFGNIRGLRRLNLRRNGLSEVPAQIGRLTSLTELNLAHNDLLALPKFIARLAALTSLDLSRNRLTVLPDALGDLAALERLDCSDNMLVELPDTIGRLTALTTLDLGRNRLSTLPDSLAHATELNTLGLSINAWTSLPRWLGALSRLQQLSLSTCKLTAIPEWLSGLTALQVLDLSHNSLDLLPPWLADLESLVKLDIDNNPLTNLPREVRAAGTSAVLTFMRELGHEGAPQWSSKMLVVGEAAVGKTSVSNALCGVAYDAEEPQTHGVHVDVLELEHPHEPDTTMRLNVWDFGGQLEYRATQRFYLTDRSLFLLVWNTRRGWRTGGQVEAWLQAITNAAPNSPVLIVATHCTESVADLDEGDLYRRHPNVKGFAQVDCKDGTGIAGLREQVANHAAALPLMGQRWPITWAAAASKLADERRRHITAQRMTDLLRRSGVDDEESRTILTAVLHDRGEILHFARDPELREIVVLQPAWVEGMITRVLDSQQIADRGGLLSRSHRAHLWHDLDDPGLREMLTAMMERFDLAYRIDAPDHEDIALVVERLPAGAPAALPAEWDQALDPPGTSELRVTYKLTSRQAGVPSWFIAREHRFTTGVAWARGVLLRHRGAPNDAWALLQDDDRAEPTIRLTVRGSTPYLFYSILNEAFTGILTERYPGLEIRQLVPCACAHDKGAPCPYEFDYTAAMRALELGHELQCQQSFSMVDPRRLLLGLRMPDHQATLARIESKIDAVASSTARIEETQLIVLDTVRDLLKHRAEQGTYCPSIFTVTKARTFCYELRLYCEQPDGPHPLPDGDGVYTLTRLPSWLRRYAPYLRTLLIGLKHGLPLAGPALIGILSEALSEATSAQLELSCKLLEDLPDPHSDKAARLFGQAHQTSRSTADFTELRKALVSLDADFGGLRERELPENRGIVYLCRHHREALRYPAQSPPQ